MSQYPMPPNPPSGAVPPPPAAPPLPYQAYAPAPRRRSAWPSLAVGCAVLVALGMILMAVLPFVAAFGVHEPLQRGNIGVIDITGEIHSGSGGLFAEAGSDQPIMEMLRNAGEDDSIDAVVLNINSPGGGPASSQAIAEEVRRLDKKKPVIASMGDMAASGAYYIASSCRKIVANPSTLTGSIGVIMQSVSIQKLLEKYGIEAEALTTGKFKDTGSPFRAMRPDEKALLQAMLLDTYEQFVKDVAEGRKLEVSKVRALADGRVWTGVQAKEVGLVDELGNLYDAIQKAADEAGVKGKPEARFLGRPRGLADLLFSSRAQALPTQLPVALPASRAYPLWMWEGAATATPEVAGGAAGR